MEPPPLLAVDDLTVTPAGAAAPVLAGVSLSVRPGERIVLTGPSGSGKSTLLRCMVLLEPVAGRVLLGGEVVDHSRVRELRRRVGYVPQRPVPIAETVAANLAFPRELDDRSLDEPAQRKILDRLGLMALRMDRRFDGLSGGEQQRIALVRSLTTRPDVLLLDEPTASLDPDNVGAVLDLLREWVEAAPERALLWVSHHTDEVESLATRHVTLAELGR